MISFILLASHRLQCAATACFATLTPMVLTRRAVATVHLAAPKTFYCGVAHTATKGVQVVGWTALGSSKETKGL